jgi:hypothetical protein
MDVPHLDAKTVLQTTCRKEEETIMSNTEGLHMMPTLQS